MCSEGRRLLIAAVILMFTAACSFHPGLLERREGGVEYGLASWYGGDFHGRRTANGEIYDMYGLSAAHKTLPLGSRVRVTNRRNGKSVVVRINDRGPFVRGRIIDLSYGAAKALEMAEEGVVPVRVEILRLGDNRYLSADGTTTAAAPMVYTVQVGAFVERANALALRQVLSETYDPVFIQEWNDGSRIFYRVRVGRYAKEEAARRLSRRLRKQNYTVYVTAQ